MKPNLSIPAPVDGVCAIEHSSIQDIDEGSPERIWDLFRRMVWMEGDTSLHAESIESIRKAYSNADSHAFGALFKAMLSDKIRGK